MGMDNRKTSGGSFVAALVFFVMTASIAIFLLLTALVVWLSEVTGSFILSSLIVGGFFAVLAAVIYLLAIREGVERTTFPWIRHAWQSYWASSRRSSCWIQTLTACSSKTSPASRSRRSPMRMLRRSVSGSPQPMR